MFPSTRLRLLRAFLFSGVCTTLGAFGHASAGGGGPVPVGALLTGGLLVAGAALVPNWRERGPLAVTSGVLGSQLALHLWFAAWALPPGGPGAADPARLLLDRLLCPAGLHHPALTPAVAPEQVPDLLRAAGLDPGQFLAAAPQHGTHWPMTAAHLLAALACAWWLRQGEAAFFRLLPALRPAGRFTLAALAGLAALWSARRPAP
ncbi:hypothetical protein, partial [Kitasatospora sp. MBT63]